MNLHRRHAHFDWTTSSSSDYDDRIEQPGRKSEIISSSISAFSFSSRPIIRCQASDCRDVRAREDTHIPIVSIQARGRCSRARPSVVTGRSRSIGFLKQSTTIRPFVSRHLSLLVAQSVFSSLATVASSTVDSTRFSLSRLPMNVAHRPPPRRKSHRAKLCRFPACSK